MTSSLRVLGGEHDDRDEARRVRGAQPPQGLVAVHARHHDVEQDDVRAHALGQLEGLPAVAGLEHVEARQLELQVQHLAQVRFVFRNQDPGLGHLR